MKVTIAFRWETETKIGEVTRFLLNFFKPETISWSSDRKEVTVTKAEPFNPFQAVKEIAIMHKRSGYGFRVFVKDLIFETQEEKEKIDVWKLTEFLEK